jgi:enterochelin esterase-like enzyme
MNRLTCLFPCLCALVTLHGQQLLQQSFTGPVTGDTVLFNIYLPAGYDAAMTGFPVVYHLHGIGGNQAGNQNTTVPAAFAEALQMGLISEKYIIVFPNGMTNSMWADSKSSLKPVETHLIKELIPYVDTHFKTLPDRGNRYIEGFSMGGFGAAKFISKYPALFQSAVIFDGALHNWQTLNANQADLAAEIFDNDEAYFNQFSPWTFMKENASILADSVCIRLAVGALTQYNRPFRDSLTVWGIPFEYLETPCAHNLGCLFAQDGLNAAVFQEDCHAASVSVVPPFVKDAPTFFYPNPVGRTLFLEPQNGFLLQQALLFDGQGKLLREEVNGADILAKGLDVSDLPSGLFFVGARTERGLFFQKIIKI